MAVNINIPSQVKTYANLAAFPASGSLKTIYIAEDTNNTYRWDGSTYVEISASAATGLTIGTTPISSGTNGRVLFQGTGNVLQQSSSLFWDGTNSRLGIGTSSPTNILTLGAAVAASLQSSAASIFTSNENASNVFVQVAASNDPVQRPVFAGTKARGTLLSPTAVQSGDAITTFLSTAFDGTAGQASAGLSFDAESNASSGNAPQLISFITGASGGTRTTKMQVRSNGNVLINTTTDAGFRLDVNGTARVQGNATVALNQNAPTRISITNTTSGNAAGSELLLTSNSSALFALGKVSSSYTLYKIIAAGDGYALNTTNGDIAILNDFATGRIKFATGGVSTAQMTLFSTGNVGINTTTDAGFKLDVNGTARVSGNLYIGNTQNQFASLNPYLFFQRGAGNGLMFTPVNAINAASQNGVVIMDSIYGYVTYAGGTHTFNALSINTNINTGGSYNGIIRGFYYNPTLTSMTGVTHYAIHTTSGRIRFENLPTSSAGLSAGDIWNDGGTLKIV
jgi:hypothetical protein